MFKYFSGNPSPASKKDVTSPSRFRSFVLTNEKAIQYIVTGYHKIKLIENFYIDQSRVYGIMLPTVYQQTEVPTNTREEMNEGNDEVLVETNEETSFERRQEMITTIIESIQSESALSSSS